MFTAQQPYRSQHGNPILSLNPPSPKEDAILVTKYIVHNAAGFKLSTYYHIPGCNDEVLDYMRVLETYGYKKIHNGVAWHMFPKEVQ